MSRYAINGRPVPRVTDILNSIFPRWTTDEWYMQRGRVVHAAAAMLAQNKNINLDLSDQSEEDRRTILGKIEGVKRFVNDHVGLVHAIEKTVYSRTYQYAGTLDLLCTLPKIKSCRDFIIDWKPNLDEITVYQEAAYGKAAVEEHICPWPLGLIVALPGDGTYRLSRVYALAQYKADWIHIRSVYAIKQRMGLIKKEERK
jgi:hypothetical protein